MSAVRQSRLAQRRSAPVLLPGIVANSLDHQRAAVIEIQADPVPAARMLVEHAARRFVIEPRDTVHAMFAAADRDATARSQLRQAVVVARELRLRALLTETVRAIQERRLRAIAFELQRELARRRHCEVTLA